MIVEEGDIVCVGVFEGDVVPEGVIVVEGEDVSEGEPVVVSVTD